MELQILPQNLRSQPFWVLLCFSLGTLSVFRVFLSILKFLYVYFLRPAKNLLEYGKWAIVTGPTDGIGKAMAFELARRGFNLVLVGRNYDKLVQVSEEMRIEVPEVELKIVVMDFSKDLGDGIKDLVDAIRDVEVGILVNNAGLMQVVPSFLHEVDAEIWENIIKVNVMAPTVVTAAVLPAMLRRRAGAIINMGSGNTTLSAFPLVSVYSSTKRYIRYFSKCLHKEYKLSGIHVQCHIPWVVATKMVPMFSPSFFIPTPSQYVPWAMRCIGYGSECIPYWTHVLQSVLLRLPPDFISHWATFNVILKIRNQMKIQEMEEAKANLRKK